MFSQIYELFKGIAVRVTYRTIVDIENLLIIRQGNDCDIREYKRNSIYRLLCPCCNKICRRQTGRSFYHGFNEHFRNCKYHNRRSKFAQHLRDNNHSIGQVEGIMNIVHVIKMGFRMNTMERLYAYKETKEDGQINDGSTVTPNILFDTVIQNDVSLTRRQTTCFDKTFSLYNKLPRMSSASVM
jgi:hypothetical protein